MPSICHVIWARVSLPKFWGKMPKATTKVTDSNKPPSIRKFARGTINRKRPIKTTQHITWNCANDSNFCHLLPTSLKANKYSSLITIELLNSAGHFKRKLQSEFSQHWMCEKVSGNYAYYFSPSDHSRVPLHHSKWKFNLLRGCWGHFT